MSVIIYSLECSRETAKLLGDTTVPFYLNSSGDILCNLGLDYMDIASSLADALGGYTLKILPKDNKINISSDLGFIFHWGIYSVPAYDSVKLAKRRNIINGSEWYMKRLLDRDSSYRPTSGMKETVEYHDKNFADKEYKDFAKDFKANKWDPDEWMKLCKKAGATYVILTARHHDGYCLWPSSVAPNWNSVDIGPKKDLILEFKKSAEKYGLVFGLYYSWLEFGKNATKEYIDTVSRTQIKELISYKPLIWFFDGDWEFKTQYALNFIKDACSEIHREIPCALINDRLGKNNKVKADYQVFADRYIPDNKLDTPWVHINTIGYSWGYNSDQKKDDYKSEKELENLIQKVRNLGGGILLNFGPTSTGKLDQNEADIITKINTN